MTDDEREAMCEALLAQLDRLTAIFVAINGEATARYVATMENYRRQWINAVVDDFASGLDDTESVWRELGGG